MEKDISINLDLKGIEGIKVNLDREKITQVILNLISNSLRYTSYGGRIDLNAYNVGDRIKIHFKDNGIGIPSERLNYIFERFYRVDDSRSKEIGGIGVGLTIVKSIVDLHGGTIEVSSREGVGSEFAVSLPRSV